MLAFLIDTRPSLSLSFLLLRRKKIIRNSGRPDIDSSYKTNAATTTTTTSITNMIKERAEANGEEIIIAHEWCVTANDVRSWRTDGRHGVDQ